MAQDPTPVDAEEVVPAKSSKKIIIIIVAAILLLAGIGGGAWFFMQHKATDTKKEEKTAEKAVAPVFVTLDAFTVNLQPDCHKYCKMETAFGRCCDGEAKVDSLKRWAILG